MLKMSRRNVIGSAILLCLAGTVLFALSDAVCIGAWVRYGISVPQCPDGAVRPAFTVRVQNLARGAEGKIQLLGSASYVARASQELRAAPIPRFDAELELVPAHGSPARLKPLDWEHGEGERTATVKLPDVPDGDYQLRAKLHSRAGDATVEVPVGLYAAARVHVITDRPLYEAGQTVKLRAVALRAKDLSPLDGRPGRWVVTDPNGDQVLDELSPAGPWGVAAGSLPLDRGAKNGEWRVQWTSGDASGEARFTVAPFTLPRFRVEASVQRPFYRAGEHPVVEGKVVYASGAPVAKAKVQSTWQVQGEWPAPVEWQEGGLERKATADEAGRFTLELPQVPMDLRGRVQLFGDLAVTDAAGERVDGSAAVLLSEDAIRASAVTELAGGLVQGFNNRVYLRATSAGDVPLSGAELLVRRAWDPRDPGLTAKTDADGVASLQLDPGPPVNVATPAMPVRHVPRRASVAIGDVQELASAGAAGLADQTALEAWSAGLAKCALFAGDPIEVPVAARVSAAGAVTQVIAGEGALGACLAESLRGRTLPAGRERLFALQLSVEPPEFPSLSASVSGSPAAPDALDASLQEALLSARGCLSASSASAELPRGLEWRAKKGSKEVALAPIGVPSEARLSAAVLDCIAARLPPKVRLDEDAPQDAIGIARVSIEAAQPEEEETPQATARLGYELEITARQDGKAIGKTRLFVAPGEVPPLRVRTTPVLASPGGPLEIEILRGPGFEGEIPNHLFVTLAGSPPRDLEVKKGARKASFPIPAGAKGWLEVDWGGAHAYAYVRPQAELAVEVRPEKPAYAPGDLARLELLTRVGASGGPAAVGLFGVDESLGQISALPGPDALSAFRTPPQLVGPAFDVLDAQALVQGRIRGENAAAATVLRVSSLPPSAPEAAPVYAEATSHFDPNEQLTESFYAVLAELHSQARTWEEKAPPSEQASPPAIAALWNKALGACEARGEPTRDAFGRRLRLSQLPPDLLAQTDPRQVIVTGTRLPEDVENWSAWVAREIP